MLPLKYHYCGRQHLEMVFELCINCSTSIRKQLSGGTQVKLRTRLALPDWYIDTLTKSSVSCFCSQCICYSPSNQPKMVFYSYKGTLNNFIKLSNDYFTADLTMHITNIERRRIVRQPSLVR